MVRPYVSLNENSLTQTPIKGLARDSDEIGIHARLKILWSAMAVWVRLPPFPQHYCSLTYRRKKNMETTLAFVLGMSVVVVIALAIVAVIGFVKAIKTEKALNEQMRNVSIEIDNRISKINRMIDELASEVHRRIDERIREEESEREKINRGIIEGDEFLHKRADDILKESEKHYEHIHRRMDDILSQMDSRFDKMISKLDKNNDQLSKELEEIRVENNKIILKD